METPNQLKLELEIWRLIPNYPNYSISTLGRIKNIKTNRILKSNYSNGKYNLISLYQNKCKKVDAIHRLCADIFIGAKPLNKEVNHKNGNKNNNSIENLEYVTRTENRRHGILLGLNDVKGELNGSAKLTEKEVIEIRNLAGILSHREIAELFKVSQTMITLIINRKRWKYLI